MGITIFSGLQGEAAVVGGQHFPNEGETKPLSVGVCSKKWGK